MATTNNLPTKQLYDHLVDGGFLTTGFTDIFGNSQPKPVVQIDELNLVRKETNSPGGVDSTDRVVFIKRTGAINAATRIYMESINMTLAVVGAVGEQDSMIAKGYMEDMQKYLNDNHHGGCITNVSFSGYNGPFITEDSRRIYELNMVVSLSKEYVPR